MAKKWQYATITFLLLIAYGLIMLITPVPLLYSSFEEVEKAVYEKSLENENVKKFLATYPNAHSDAGYIGTSERPTSEFYDRKDGSSVSLSVAYDPHWLYQYDYHLVCYNNPNQISFSVKDEYIGEFLDNYNCFENGHEFPTKENSGLDSKMKTGRMSSLEATKIIEEKYDCISRTHSIANLMLTSIWTCSTEDDEKLGYVVEHDFSNKGVKEHRLECHTPGNKIVLYNEKEIIDYLRNNDCFK